MTNLVPEKRLDKNNRLVTRHIRANGADSPSAALPAPVVTPVAPSRDDLLNAREELMQVLEDYDEAELVEGGLERHVRVGMHSLDYDTVLLIKNSVTNSEMSALCLHMIADFSDSTQEIREVLHYRESIPMTSFTNTVGYNFSDECLGMTRGIHEMYEFRNCADLTKLPEDEARQVHALLRVGYALYSTLGASNHHLSDSCKFGIGSRYPLRIVDHKLVKLVMENPTKDESIVSLIASHANADADFLREALRTESSSLRGGVL